MEAAVTECLRDAESELRIDFGTELFKIGKETAHCRTTGGDLSQDFGEDGPRKRSERIRLVAWKDDWPGKPFNGQGVIWCPEGGKEIRMMVERARGAQVSSPTWQIDLVSK